MCTHARSHTHTRTNLSQLRFPRLSGETARKPPRGLLGCGKHPERGTALGNLFHYFLLSPLPVMEGTRVTSEGWDTINEHPRNTQVLTIEGGTLRPARQGSGARVGEAMVEGVSPGGWQAGRGWQEDHSRAFHASGEAELGPWRTHLCGGLVTPHPPPTGYPLPWR